MSYILDLDPPERAEVFEAAEADLGIPAHVLEKDFWVTYILDALFQGMEDLDVRIMFKGGTSLSKCYSCISRFSEDIDVALNREDLGFTDDKAPENQSSKTQARKRLAELKNAGIEYVEEELLPSLISFLENDLNEDFTLYLDEDNPENLLFEYPRSLDEYLDESYVKPVVLIETGTKSAHDPSEEIEIFSLFTGSESVEEAGLYADEHSTTVTSLCISRTFWEKVTFVHQQCSCDSADKVKDRLSRHLYDIHQIYHSDHGQQCLEDLDLLEKVAKHKATYFQQRGVDYHNAYSGGLDMTMSEDLQDAFQEDYARMDEMIYGDKPDFDDLLETLDAIEQHVNDELDSNT